VITRARAATIPKTRAQQRDASRHRRPIEPPSRVDAGWAAMRCILEARRLFFGIVAAEHGYHAKNENFDWGMASGGIKMFVRYFDRISSLSR